MVAGGRWLVVTRFRDVDTNLKDPAGSSSAPSLRPVRDLYPSTFAAPAGGYPPKPDHITSDGAAVDQRTGTDRARVPLVTSEGRHALVHSSSPATGISSERVSLMAFSACRASSVAGAASWLRAAASS